MPFRGGARATSATTPATSSAAIGWNSPGETLTLFADDGVGDAGGLDQLLLGNLGAEIAIVRKTIGADNRQGDVVFDSRFRFGSEKILCRRLKKFKYRPVFPGGGI